MRRVAITGLGVVSPLGVGRDVFWDSLASGRSGIDRITRFDCSTFDVQLAGEVRDELDLPQDVARIACYDPKVGFAWAAAAQALSDAECSTRSGDCLIHFGASLETFNLEHLVSNGNPDIARAVAESVKSDAAPLQTPLDTAARLVAAAFSPKARTLTNCSACAAGAQAIGHGFRSVRSGRTDFALCGGFDSMINPLGLGGFQMLGALTTDNERGAFACRPFDASRSGTVLGEGAAMVVMEPLDTARAAGKFIYAEVCGYGSTMDAHNLSAPDPEGEGAERAMRAALQDAGIESAAVHHINTHGTGTRLNDAVEAAAIRRVFCNHWEHIPVCAVKSMTGHLIAAAGAVEAIACIFTLNRNLIPVNVSLENIDDACRLAHVQGQAMPFSGKYVLSNSFGFGGQNASLAFRRYDG